MLGNIHTLDIQVPHEIVQYWGWFRAFGVGLLLLGVIAIARSVTATIVSMLFFGWLLVLACGIEIAKAVMVGHRIALAVERGAIGFRCAHVDGRDRYQHSRRGEPQSRLSWGAG
jgi:hypothetical protein